MIGVEYTEGVCDDGAAILANGRMMTISEVLETLNSYSKKHALIETIFKAVSDHPENSALGSTVRQIISAEKDVI